MDTFSAGHGACKVCSCTRFTWAAYLAERDAFEEVDQESQNQAARAFKRFETWLEEREFDTNHKTRFMYMGIDKTGDWYLFKNINTRNYVRVNIVQTTFSR
jgi:hypothetical protein